MNIYRKRVPLPSRFAQYWGNFYYTCKVRERSWKSAGRTKKKKTYIQSARLVFGTVICVAWIHELRPSECEDHSSIWPIHSLITARFELFSSVMSSNDAPRIIPLPPCSSTTTTDLLPRFTAKTLFGRHRQGAFWIFYSLLIYKGALTRTCQVLTPITISLARSLQNVNSFFLLLTPRF